MTIEALLSSLNSWATAQPTPITLAVMKAPPPILSLPLNPAEAAESRGVCLTILASTLEGAPRLGFWLPASGRGGSYVSTVNGEEEFITNRLPDFTTPHEAQALIDPLAKGFLNDCSAPA